LSADSQGTKMSHREKSPSRKLPCESGGEGGFANTGRAIYERAESNSDRKTKAWPFKAKKKGRVKGGPHPRARPPCTRASWEKNEGAIPWGGEGNLMHLEQPLSKKRAARKKAVLRPIQNVAFPGDKEKKSRARCPVSSGAFESTLRGKGGKGGCVNPND